MSKTGRGPGIDLATLFGIGAVGRLSDAELLARFVRRRGCRLVRGGVLGAGGSARADGAGRLPADAGRRPRRGRCLPGGIPRPGPQGAVGAGGRFARAMAPRGQRPGGAAGAGHGRRGTGPDAGRWTGSTRPTNRPSDRPVSSRDDLRSAIDEEIARLPGRYRSAVVLCYLEGLTQEQAARRLRCPVGTIQSRLHRARERLRPALVAARARPRGLGRGNASAPGSEVPPGPGRGSTAAAARVGCGAGTLGRDGPGGRRPCLRDRTIRRMAMIQGMRIGLRADGTGPDRDRRGDPGRRRRGTGAAARRRDPRPRQVRDPGARRPSAPPDPDAGPEARDDPGRVPGPAGRPVPGPREGQGPSASGTRSTPRCRPTRSRSAAGWSTWPRSSPADPAARDALVWVLNKPGRADTGPYGDEFARAAALLVRHHGDDPEAVRIGLGVSNQSCRPTATPCWWGSSPRRRAARPGAWRGSPWPSTSR